MKPWQIWLFRITLGVFALAALFTVWKLYEEESRLGMQKVVDTLARTRLSNVAAFVAVLTVFRVTMAPYLRGAPIHLRAGEFKAGKMLTEFLDALVYAGVFVFMIIRPFAVQAFLIPSGSMWPTLYVNDFIVANKAIYRYTEPKDNDVVVFRPPNRAAHPDQLDAEGNITVDFVKRLIGTPGEVVELRKGVLYRNGKPDAVDEQHTHYSVCADQPPPPECQNFSEMPAADRNAMTKASFKLVVYQGKVLPLNYSDTDANSPNPAPVPGEQYAPYEPVPKEYQIEDPVVQRELMNAPAQPIPKGMFLFMGDNRNGSDDGRFWGLVPRNQIIGRAEFVWLPLSRIGRVH